MLNTNYPIIRGVQYKRTVSDTFMIRKVSTEEVYSEAVDLMDSGNEYEETETLLPQNPIADDPLEIIDILTGEAT